MLTACKDKQGTDLLLLLAKSSGAYLSSLWAGFDPKTAGFDQRCLIRKQARRWRPWMTWQPAHTSCQQQATACIIGICCGLPCDSAIAADFDLLWSKNGVNFFKVWPAHTIQLFNYEIHTKNSNIIVLILPGHIGLSKPKQKTGSKKKSELERIRGNIHIHIRYINIVVGVYMYINFYI